MKKPSEYIKIGCELRPFQVFGTMYQHSHSSCAAGAFIDGYSGERRTDYDPLGIIWNQIVWQFQFRSRIVACPECGPDFPNFPDQLVSHLNDHHKWTRERIGDWLDAQMPQDPVGSNKIQLDATASYSMSEEEDLELVDA